MSVLGSLATINSIVLNVCPLFDDIPAIKRSRTTGDRSPIVFVAIWANALLWVDYGIYTKAFYPISTTNLVGLVTGSYFLWTFHQYAPPLAKSQFLQSFSTAAALVTLVYMYTFVFPNGAETTQARLGAICCIVTVGLYGSPIGTVIRAIQLRTNKPISLFFALVGTSNSILWAGFGLLKADPWLYLPNILGALLTIFQLVVYFWYSGRYGKNYAIELTSGGGSVALKRPSLSELSMQSAMQEA